MGIVHQIGKALCLLFLCSAALVATQPPGMRDSFFEALRAVHNENPDHEILELARNEQVLELLEVNIEQRSTFEASMKQAFEAMKELHNAQGDNPLSAEELKTEIRKASEQNNSKAFEALGDKSKLDRLIGIFVQWRGESAAACGQVASRIELDGDALTKFREKKAKLWSELMSDVRDEMKDAMRERDHQERRRKMHHLMSAAKDNMNAELKLELTEEQKNKLHSLRGEEVKNIHELLDQRGGPGPGRGGNGNPSDSERGGKPRDRERPR